MKRTWTLLLAVLVLAMILAVPAMAADNTHTAGSHPTGTWNQLTSGTTELTEGKYYLAGDITASITKTSGDIVICLNGKTWEGSGARPLAVTAGSVTICDCAYTAPTVASDGTVSAIVGGKIVGHEYSGATGSGNGGAVLVKSGASFTLESGTITGGHAEYGGNIYSDGNVTISGAVRDGEVGVCTNNKYTRAGWGGNINANSGTLTISGGIISGGKSGGNGGNIRALGGVTSFTMTSGIIVGGDSRDNGGNIMNQTSMSLTGGTVTLGTANSGGNISNNAGGKTIVLTDVTITNGSCCGKKNDNSNIGTVNSNSGGNIRIFNASPASVTIGDGTEITGGASNAADGGKNVYIGKTTTVNIGSATIGGHVFIADGSTVNLSGAPSITGGTVNLSIGSSTLNAANMTGGSVGITATGEGRAFSAAGTSAYAGYFSTDSGSKLGVAYHAGGTNMWLGVKYCICGASKNGSDEHVQFTDADGNTVGCDGTDLVWLPWQAAHVTYAKNTGYVYKVNTNPCKAGLPMSGNYYLDGDVTTTGQTYTETGTSSARTALNIDLNGHKISTSSNRGFTLSAYSTLSITDTAGGGQVVNTANHDQGGIVWATGGYSVFNLYGGKMDATKFSNRGSTTKGGAAVEVSSGSAKFYMFGGELYGSRVDDPDTEAVEGFTASASTSVAVGTATSASGGYKSRLPAAVGALNLSGNGSHAYIYGGTIYGGTVQYVECMKSSASSKITATQTYGGNGAAVTIMSTGAVVDIYGGTIHGGKAVEATASATDAEGNVTETTGGGKGGAIYSIGTLNIYGGSITGGTDGNGNANCVYVAEGTMNVYPLAAGSEIEVYAAEAGKFANVTSAVSLADKACFTSDNDDYIVALTANGLELVAKDAHIHCPCNGSLGNASNNYTHMAGGNAAHVCREVVYTATDSMDDLTAGGAYYLTAGITGSIEPTASLDLCLNGQAWANDGTQRPLYVNSGITVGIADCAGSGTIAGYAYGTADNGGVAYVTSKGTLNLYGGTLNGNTAKFAGNVYISSGGTFNMYGGTITGGQSSGNGGSVRVDGTMYMYGGLITGGKSGDQGGNIFCGGTMYLYGGSVTGGQAKNGGNIAYNSNKDSVMQGVTVIGGVTTTDGGKTLSGNGGNVGISSTQSKGSLTIGTGTTISGGRAKNGGNISATNNTAGGSTSWSVTLNIAGGTIESGDASGYGDNVYVKPGTKDSVVQTLNLNISGGTVAGYVYAADGTNVTLSGAPVVDGGEDCTSNLNLNSNKFTVGATMSKDARVYISCTDAANGTVVSESIATGANITGILYHNSEYKVVLNSTDGTLYLTKAVALLNGDGKNVYTKLEDAIAAVKNSTDFVTLVADHTGNLTVTGDLMLDLNGCTVNGNITISGQLKLVDSATSDYSVAEQADGKTYGKVTGTITNVARYSNTPKATYGHNYRFVVVKDENGYHAHRIYLTIKSTILYPQTAALNYRTVLRCDEYLAELINNSDAGYGVLISGHDYDAEADGNMGEVTYAYGDYIKNNKKVGAYSATNENNMVTQLGNILEATNKGSAYNQYCAAQDVVAKAYLWIEDDLNTATVSAEAINEKAVLSSGVTYSLKNMILLADRKADELNQAQQIALGSMYGTWEALMESWGMTNIPGWKNATVRFGCLCGDPTSTNNPCAEKGHVEFAWEQWTETTSLPTTSGNYYLTGNVTLSTQHSVAADRHININTCGHEITSSTDRIALVYGIFNLTNYPYSGMTADTSVLSAHGHNTGDSGGAFLIQSTGNMSFYDNITVQATADHGIKLGLIGVSGSLNLYGTNITGADLTAQEGNGGAVNVFASGSMYMNSGTITGGTALNGGAIYAAGDVTIEGTARITGGAVVRNAADNGGSNGGNIYIAKGGSATLAGGTVENGLAGDYDNKTFAGWGGNITVASGGSLTIKTGAMISGGKANGNGGSVHVEDGATFNMSGGTLTGGKTRDQGGNLFVNTATTITGGTITLGEATNGGNIALGNTKNAFNLTLKGVTVSEGYASSTGGNIRAQNHNDVATSLTIEAGTTISGGDADSNGGNIQLNCALTVNGGKITGGTAKNGGNIALSDYALTISGGEISNGSADNGSSKTYGGNIYVTGTGSSLTISGGQILNGTTSTEGTTEGVSYGGSIYAGCNVQISGGTISNGHAYGHSNSNAWGGNIYVTGTLEISGSALIKEGYSSYNSGNIHVAGSSFTMTGGTVRDGWGYNTTGNIYIGASTIANISGNSSITGGKSGSAQSTTESTSNMYVVGGTLNLSGGTISGGVNVRSHSGEASLTLSGAPTVSGCGILLSHGSKTVDGVADYYPINVDVTGLDTANASVVLRYVDFKDEYADGICLVSGTASEALARNALRDYASETGCEITYEKTGIYIRKSTKHDSKWSCSCGANYGETHVNGCDGYDVEYKEWTAKSLPNQPGYWYLSYSTTTNAAGVEYVQGLDTSTMKYDYYLDNGTYKKIHTVNALSTAGKTMTNDLGKYVTVAEYVAKYGADGPSYASAVGSTVTQTVAYVDTAGKTYTSGQVTPLSEYAIYVDLNGYKLETVSGGRTVSFRGLADKTVDGKTYNTCRNANVTLNILDSSEDHTGAIATYGVYTGVTADGKQTLHSSGGTQWQGKMIWMVHPWDTLNTSYVTLDASSTITGSGLVLYNDGAAATFNNSTIIGGTAQGFYIGGTGSSRDTISGGSATGGGAIYITNDGTVTLNGGTVKNGTSIYRTVLNSKSGTTSDFGIGGGNIFVGNGTLNINGATITGGKSLIYSGTEKHRLPSHSYGSGGGVYVYHGQVNISGNTVIKNNYTGTISGSLLTVTNTTDNTNKYGNNYYNCVDVQTAKITTGVASNLFMGGNNLTLKNLTGEVHYSMKGTGTSYATYSGTDHLGSATSYNLNTGGYVGTFATYTGTAPTTSTLKCDDSGAPAFTVKNNKVYYPATSKNASGTTLSGNSVYMVGYGKASVQPRLTDLQGGMTMTNYGNTRNTADLYGTSGYYDIIKDSSNYLGTWDTTCYATVLATTDGEGDTVLIIALDGQTHSTDVANKVKRMVSYATGVPQDNISISSGHQHSIPGPSTIYKTATTTDETGAEVTYNVLDANGRATVISDYASVYYTGIVRACVNAMNDRKQATVKVGTLETTADGKQYNFVRNVELWSGGKRIGMQTDNHNTHYYVSGTGWVAPGTLAAVSNVTRQYETKADTTMQLVQYTQVGGSTIVMANFQTHPHLGSGSSSNYVHSDVIGSFRHYLEKTSGYKVMYFSGGSGNINASTKLSEDESKYPYTSSNLTASDSSVKNLQKADLWGQSMASMAYKFLKGTTYTGSTAMKAVSGSNDVAVEVRDYNGTRATSDASDNAIKKITQIRNWSDGSYVTEFVSFDYDNWVKYVGYSAKAVDHVYSSFDSNRIREHLLWAEADLTEYHMDITAYAMGEIGFIAAPYEMFHENGSQIKAGATDYAMTIVSTLANGGNGYIPSAEGFSNGGYSTDNCRFASGTGEELANTFIEMLNGLQ